MLRLLVQFIAADKRSAAYRCAEFAGQALKPGLGNRVCRGGWSFWLFFRIPWPAPIISSERQRTGPVLVDAAAEFRP